MRKARQEAEDSALAADKQKALADQKAKEAIRNQSLALTALADNEAARRPVNATKLALAAWPRGDGATNDQPQLSETLHALSRSVPGLHERRLLRNYEDGLVFAAFTADGTRVISNSGNNTAHVWDADTGRVL